MSYIVRSQENGRPVELDRKDLGVVVSAAILDSNEPINHDVKRINITYVDSYKVVVPVNGVNSLGEVEGSIWSYLEGRMN